MGRDGTLPIPAEQLATGTVLVHPRQAPAVTAVALSANRWYPSSKTCCDCKHIHVGLTLKDRVWTCDNCGVVRDRDRNAANNLRFVAESSLAAASLREVVRRPPVERSALAFGLAARVKLTAMKQASKHGIFFHV